MDRRDFLTMASWAGLSCVLPSVVDPLRGSAQSITGSAYTGTYWIFMHAGGGWDPTHLCDPKGRVNENENDPMGRFLRSDIRTAGNIEYAPLGDDGAALDAFFQEHYQRLLVINGMDTGTNGHDQGTRGTWSGRTAEGHPPILPLSRPHKGIFLFGNGPRKDADSYRMSTASRRRGN